jgi:hypothetical protein
MILPDPIAAGVDSDVGDGSMAREGRRPDWSARSAMLVEGAPEALLHGAVAFRGAARDASCVRDG